MASAAADEESSVLKSSAADSIQVWIASFLRYLELRLQLLGREARPLTGSQTKDLLQHRSGTGQGS